MIDYKEPNSGRGAYFRHWIRKFQIINYKKTHRVAHALRQIESVDPHPHITQVKTHPTTSPPDVS